MFLGSIAQLTNGDMKKASLVDIGEQTNPLLEWPVQLQVIVKKIDLQISIIVIKTVCLLVT